MQQQRIATRTKRPPWTTVAIVALLFAAAAATAIVFMLRYQDKPWTVTTPGDVPGAQLSHAQWSIELRGRGPRGSSLTLARPSEPDAPWRPALTDLTRQAGITIGVPVHVALSGGRVPRAGAVLAHVLDSPLPPGATAALAYYVPAHHAWEAVPTALSADRRTLTARVHHFSVWDDIEYAVGWVLDTRVAAPACDQPQPQWVDSVVYLDDKNAPVRWCAGEDPKDPTILVVKVAVNRSYGVAVQPALPPKWSYSSVFGQGPEDFSANVFARAASVPYRIRSVFGGEIPVMGGEEADFGFTQAQVRSLAGKPLIRVSPDVKDAIAGLTFTALTGVAGGLGKRGAAIVALAVVAQCEGEIGGPLIHRDWTGALQGGKKCLQETYQDITVAAASGLAGAFPKLAPEGLGKAAGKLVGKVWEAWLAGEAFQLGTWYADRHLLDSAFELTAFAAIHPKKPPTTTTTTTSATSVPTPSTTTPSSAPSGSLSVGAPFNSECVVAWPTAPVTTSTSIEMTMSCSQVPENEYLFTEVIYDNPNLPISPDHAQAHVIGRIVDTATSAYGYRELIVQASSVQVR